jgi:hypothetical protein
VSLADALEAAASALPEHADAIRPANGDPVRLLDLLGPAAGAPVLAWLLAHRPVEGAELAEAWSVVEGGAEAVLALDETGLEKPGRKALRRLRHRLRSQGVEVPEAPPAARVARLPAIDDAFHGAYVSPIDPTGARLVYLVEPNPAGGARLFEIVCDDARGVLGCEVYTASRRQARAFLAELRGRRSLRVAEVAPEAARALVAAAARRQPPERPAPRSFGEWRSRLTAVPAGTQLPGELAREALGEPEERPALAQAVALVREGRVGPWPPPGDALALLFERIRTALEGPLVLSEAVRGERIATLVAEASEECFAGEAGEVAAHRFRESAYVFWQQGEPEAAHACLAAASRFAAGEPRENPVALALLEAALGPALATLEAAREEAPEDAARAAAVATASGAREGRSR